MDLPPNPVVFHHSLEMNKHWVYSPTSKPHHQVSCPTFERRNTAAVFACCAMSRRRGAFSAFEKTAQVGAVGGHGWLKFCLRSEGKWLSLEVRVVIRYPGIFWI